MPITFCLIGVFYLLKLIIKLSPTLTRFFGALCGELLALVKFLLTFTKDLVAATVRAVIACASDLLRVPRAIVEAVLIVSKFTVRYELRVLCSTFIAPSCMH